MVTSAPISENDIQQEKREEIIVYIKGRLGVNLASVYDEAIKSSVSTGCYDHDWSGVPPYNTIEHYLTVLRQDWLHRQGDRSAIISRVFEILDFGSEEEKHQLTQLLGLRSEEGD